MKDKEKNNLANLASLVVLLIGVAFVGLAVGYNSIWFRVLIGGWGILIILRIFMRTGA